MKRDFTKVIETLDGKAIVLDDKKGDKLTYQDAILSALQSPGENTIPANEKLKRWKLVQKMYNTPDADFTVEEIATINKVIGESAWGVLVVGRITDLIETDPLDKDK